MQLMGCSFCGCGTWEMTRLLELDDTAPERLLLDGGLCFGDETIEILCSAFDDDADNEDEEE